MALMLWLDGMMMMMNLAAAASAHVQRVPMLPTFGAQTFNVCTQAGWKLSIKLQLLTACMLMIVTKLWLSKP
jgi:hypothetical protein